MIFMKFRILLMIKPGPILEILGIRKRINKKVFKNTE